MCVQKARLQVVSVVNHDLSARARRARRDHKKQAPSLPLLVQMKVSVTPCRLTLRLLRRRSCNFAIEQPGCWPRWSGMHAVRRVSLGLLVRALARRRRGALVVASVCGVEASVHLFDGDREVTFSCGAGRISSACGYCDFGWGCTDRRRAAHRRSVVCVAGLDAHIGTPQLQAACSTKRLMGDGRSLSIFGAQVNSSPK